MYASRPLRKIIYWNAVLVLCVGVYGVFTDEPYWRAVGHRPWLYDYVFWFGLALNGPSGFGADYLSWLTDQRASGHELRFLVQYGLWLLLLPLQWMCYRYIAIWCNVRRWRETVLYTISVSILVLGCFAAYRGWIWGHRPSIGFIDRYFWFVRMAALALSGLTLLAYAFLGKSRDQPA
jgi:hypothetical protein